MEIKLKNKLFLAVIMLLVVLLVISGATYAWFTSNQRAYTNRISGKTSSESVSLFLSASGGANFVKKNECAIAQVNKTDNNFLLPVSTDDLATFIESNGRGYNEIMKDESRFYHGRVYMLAEAEGSAEPKKLDIFLNNSDSMFKKDANSNLLNAARLGLTFGGENPVIFSLSQTTNPKNEQVNNTYIDGVLIAGDIVLHAGPSGAISAVSDPSVFYNAFDVSATGSQPLIQIETGKEYAIDIYFYLEGCDPDCHESISKDGANINLQFMGILIE